MTGYAIIRIDEKGATAVATYPDDRVSYLHAVCDMFALQEWFTDDLECEWDLAYWSAEDGIGRLTSYVVTDTLQDLYDRKTDPIWFGDHEGVYA